MAPGRARTRVASEGSVIWPNPSQLSNKLTAEYHDTLRQHSRLPGADQRSIAAATDVSRDTEATLTPSTTTTATTARRWLPARPKTSDCNAKPPRKYSAGKRDNNSSSASNIISPPLHPLSREEIEEFETLPIAVRRKYFSSLERLRFAQSSGALHDSPGLDGLFRNSPRSFTFSEFDTSQRNTHSRSETLVSTGPISRSQSSTSVYKTPTSHTDPFAGHHRNLSRAEQLALARCLRESVILDAADEAIYKIGRRSDRRAPQSRSHAPGFASSKLSKETQAGRMVHSTSGSKDGLESSRDTFYDSFRWLEGDDDLDLSLQLDDYHANLKESLPRHSTEHRPSFRRHLSINKIPFGRSSLSTSRPGTNSGSHTPSSPPTNSPAPQPPLPVRRKSRALSLINTRPVLEEPVPPFDPDAAHYQDPEARAKLRVYLASPQKFDEAVEFGFPAKNAIANMPDHERQSSRGHSRRLRSQDSSKFKTFFSDDHSSIYSEESLPDPESPRTPNSPDKADLQQDSPVDDAKEAPFRPPMDGYAQIPASSREMTLRMTLTRPDLRAGDDEIYGWQKRSPPQTVRTSPRLEDVVPPKKTLTGNTGKSKENLEAFFASLDEEEEAAAASTADTGVVKRFWNKVRRN
ncbi:hypothetical protein KJ359_005756 [Pestalotiopsis sp. 9143b]|nr:hypothetical protein KJ359_005756 [Pestalotiopsis sp. 9143b]